MADTKSLMVQVGADTKAMEDGLNKAGNDVKKLEDKIKKVGKAMTVAGGVIIGALGGMVKKASDAQETYSKFGTVFKDVFNKAEDAALDLAKGYGLSMLASKDMLAATGDLLTGLGVNSGAALDLSEKTQQLAVDLASFTNYSGGAKGASEALTKAMLGERESIKSLGIVITEEMVKEKLAAEGKETLTGLAYKQAAAEATLAIAYSQSKNAIGDYGRTSGNLANVVRSLKGDFENLFVEIGAKLIPVVTDIGIKIKATVQKVLEWMKENPKLSETLTKIAAVVGIVLAVLGPLLVILPALAAGFSILLGPVGLVIAAITAIIAIGVLLVKNWGKIKDFFGNIFKAIKRKFLDWAIGIVGILEKIPFIKKLAGPWKETLQSMRDEMDETEEKVENFSTVLNMVGSVAAAKFTEVISRAKEETGLLNQGLMFLTEGAAAAGTSFEVLRETTEAEAEAIAAANKKITDMTVSMIDEIKKATLDEYEYSQWALEQKYLNRIAAIEEEKASEDSKNKALALAKESYRLDQEALEAAHIKELYDKRKEAIKVRLEKEKEQFEKREAMQIAYKDAKSAIIDTINSLVMSELDYAIWAMDEERKERESAIDREIKDEDKKAELLSLINDEYRMREATERKKHADKMTELETDTFQVLQSLYASFIDDTLQGFIDWGEGTGTLLEGVGTAFKNLATDAIAALKSLLVQEMLNAAKTLIAKKVEAIASVIASVMKSIPFPLNLVLAGVAIAAVIALFSSLKLKEGGLVTAPTTALIGEAGPELVIPLDKLGSMQPALGGGAVFKQHNYFYGDISNAGDIDEISNRLAEKTRRSLERGA